MGIIKQRAIGASRIIACLIACVLCFTAVPASAALAANGVTPQTNGFWSGTGTALDPYLIADEADLRKLASGTNSNSVNGGAYSGIFFLLTSDITLTQTWTSIGNKPSSKISFAGNFDGGGHSISSLTNLATADECAGLFGRINGATLKNFTVSGSVTASTGSNRRGAAGVVVIAQGNNVLENIGNEVNVTNSLDSNYGVAGIVNAIESGSTTIKNCYNKGTITGFKNDGGSNSVPQGTGGIVGLVSYAAATITSSYNTGSILDLTPDSTSDSKWLAGIIGRIQESNTSLINCFNAGNSTEDNFGPLVYESSTFLTSTNNYYLASTANASSFSAGTGISDATVLKSQATVDALNSGGSDYKLGLEHPILSWEPDPVFPTDYSALKSLIATAKTTYDPEAITISVNGNDVSPNALWVTQQDIDDLNNAIDIAQGIVDENTSTQGEVDSAAINLGTAISTFVAKPGIETSGKKDALQSTIDTVPATQGKKSDAAWNALKAVLAEVQPILTNPDATAEQVVAAQTKLEDAIKAFNDSTDVSTPLAAKDFVVSKIADKVYTGKNLKPTLVVTLDDGTKLKSSDYSVSYSNNKNVGKATVNVTGNGEYKDISKTVTFKIVPKKTAVKKITVSKKKLTVTWAKASKAQKVTHYQVRYKVKGASAWKIKTVAAKNGKVVLKSLKSGKKYQVQVQVQKKIGNTKYLSAWSKVKTSKKIK